MLVIDFIRIWRMLLKADRNSEIVMTVPDL